MPEVQRKLKDNEIEYVIDFITVRKGIPEKTAQSIMEINKEKLINQLKKIEIYPSLIDELKEEIKKNWFACQITPGESVGIITAQSIGERQTQQTLNTFHSTGITSKTVMAGVPRFSELLNTAKESKAPCCTIYFKNKYETIQEIRSSIKDSIKENFLQDLLEEEPSYTHEIDEKDWYQDFSILFNVDYTEYDTRIITKFNKFLLFENHLTLEKIAKKIEDSYSDIIVMYSLNHLYEIHIFLKTGEIKNEDCIFKNDEEAILMFIEEIVISTLRKIKVGGIDKVKNIFYEKKGKEWTIDTEGGDLKQILSHPLVDSTKTYSNNIWEIYRIFGIEGVRQYLIEEFSSVISSDGTFVNDSHTKLLVDIMTFSGTITSISRYGMKKETCGPMAKASFEESLDNFLRAGVFGEKETTDGVSASIMLGKIAKFGTGICDIKMDVNKMLPPTIHDKIILKKVFEK